MRELRNGTPESQFGTQIGTATVSADGTFKQVVTVESPQTGTGQHKLVAVQNGTVQADITLPVTSSSGQCLGINC